MKKLALFVILVALLLISLVGGGCNPPQGEGFAIYLTAQELSVGDMRQVALSEVQLADKPLISVNDIVSYSKETHEIELTPDAYALVKQLRLPMTGTVFIVCVDRKPIYWGLFWSIASSQGPPHDVVYCYIPGALGAPIGSIRLDYPPMYDSSKDPRSNSEIMRSLDRAGKLK